MGLAANAAHNVVMPADSPDARSPAPDTVSLKDYEELLVHYIKLKAQSDAAHVGLAILAKKMGISLAEWQAMMVPVREETLYKSWAVFEDWNPAAAARLDTRALEADIPEQGG